MIGPQQHSLRINRPFTWRANGATAWPLSSFSPPFMLVSSSIGVSESDVRVNGCGYSLLDATPILLAHIVSACDAFPRPSN
jgi:hypothetical protein